MNCCLQKDTIHQFTYFIYYLFQDNFKNAKIMKIQEVHQKIQTKPIFPILFKLFSIGDSFEFNTCHMRHICMPVNQTIKK